MRDMVVEKLCLEMGAISLSNVVALGTWLPASTDYGDLPEMGDCIMQPAQHTVAFRKSIPYLV